MLPDHKKNYHQEIFLNRMRILNITVVVYADLNKCNLISDNSVHLHEIHSHTRKILIHVHIKGLTRVGSFWKIMKHIHIKRQRHALHLQTCMCWLVLASFFNISSTAVHHFLFQSECISFLLILRETDSLSISLSILLI